jgi:type IV pilus assembly protein PilY1
LFIATDASGARQPISARPSIAFGPGGGLLLLFGTGQLPFEAVGRDRQPVYSAQSFYAVLDRAGTTGPATAVGAVTRILGRDDLASRHAAPGPAGAPAGEDTPAALIITGAPFLYGPPPDNRLGWVLDFLDGAATGERAAHDPALLHGVVVFNTQLPGKAGCQAYPGRSYALDALTGLAWDGTDTGRLSKRLLRPSPLVEPLTLSSGDAGKANGLPSARQRYVARYGWDGAGQQALGGSGRELVFNRRGGVFAWREIGNWNELHAAR